MYVYIYTYSLSTYLSNCSESTSVHERGKVLPLRQQSMTVTPAISAPKLVGGGGIKNVNSQKVPKYFFHQHTTRPVVLTLE